MCSNSPIDLFQYDILDLIWNFFNIVNLSLGINEVCASSNFNVHA